MEKKPWIQACWRYDYPLADARGDILRQEGGADYLWHAWIPKSTRSSQPKQTCRSDRALCGSRGNLKKPRSRKMLTEISGADPSQIMHTPPSDSSRLNITIQIPDLAHITDQDIALLWEEHLEETITVPVSHPRSEKNSPNHSKQNHKNGSSNCHQSVCFWLPQKRSCYWGTQWPTVSSSWKRRLQRAHCSVCIFGSLRTNPNQNCGGTGIFWAFWSRKELLLSCMGRGTPRWSVGSRWSYLWTISSRCHTR